MALACEIQEPAMGAAALDGVIDSTAFIHRFAHVVGSSVGPRTRVWQFASVIRNARIGADCNIAAYAIVDGSRIGDRCIISHGAFIDPGMEIHDEVFIGPHVALCNDCWPRVDKSGFQIDALISGQVVTTTIEKGASLGAGVIVLPGRRIGEGAMVAAGARVLADVPAQHLMRSDGTIDRIDPKRRQIRMRSCL